MQLRIEAQDPLFECLNLGVIGYCSRYINGINNENSSYSPCTSKERTRIALIVIVLKASHFLSPNDDCIEGYSDLNAA